MRFIKRLFFYLFKSMLYLLGFLSYRKRQFYYNKLLRFYGMHLTGEPRFISNSAYFDDFHKITLGNRVVISSNVIFLTHDYSVTTALLSIDKYGGSDVALLKNIKIGNNVFIGMNAVLLPGVIVEDNVIIGAGAVVRGHLIKDSIYIGNPAIRIKSLREFAFNIDVDAFETRIDNE